MGSCNSKPTAPEIGEDVFIQRHIPSSDSQLVVENTSAVADEQSVSSKKIQRRSSSKNNVKATTTNPRTSANPASAPIPSSSSHSSRSNKQSSSSSSLVDSNTIDPRWSELFTILHSHILDPEDLPATLDATISKTIDLLSPVEVSFIRRRVKYSIGTIVHNTEGNDVDIASSVGRSSLSKKMGRLLGKEVGDKSLSYSSSFYNNESTQSRHIHPALVENSLIPYESRIKASKMVYQKERLIDITIMRKIFEGGEQCLKHMQLQVKTGRKGSVSKTSSPSRQHDKNNHDQISSAKDASSLNESLGNIDIYGSAYLLLMYMSETRWDYITEIARHSAKRAGLILDVNELALQKAERERKGKTWTKRENGKKNNSSRRLLSSSGLSIPTAVPIPTMTSPAEIYDNPDLITNEHGGIHFTSLCYLVALALRGTRRQKLNLLFHLLLPPKELDNLLSSHPAGIPTWLLEVDEDVVLSYDSLSYYYAYDGVMLPLESHESERKMNVKKNATTNGSAGKKKLFVDGASVVEILATILSRSSNAASANSEQAYGIQRLSETVDANADHIRGQAKSQEQYPVSQMLSNEIAEDGTEPNILFSEYEKRSLKGFIDRCKRVTSSSFGSTHWSMRDFVVWADVAIDETVLDKLMHNLFGTGIIPTAKLENTLVTQQWINWNTAQDLDVIDTGSEDGARQKERLVSNKYGHVWGGIGGIDGKGGLGHGVLYCIEKSWWDSWVAYAGWEATEYNGPNLTSLKRPRALSTELLIDRSVEAISMSGTRGSYEYMKPKLSLGKDYVLIPPGVWNVLYELYGGGPPLPRMVLPSGDEGSTNGTHNGNIVSADDESVEVSSMMQNNARRRYPRAIAKSLRVVIHPWIINCQICDPKQPYRRGDLGPMSIRVMAMPRQPLWRLFAEIVERLPITSSKDPDSNICEGRGRLWSIAYVNGKVPVSRYGPWTLLCKNSYAEIPIGTSNNYDKYKQQWQSYCDKHSVESVGLLDGSRVMFEYVLPSKDGNFKWPREAAAKATHLRRIADEDTKFRILLRGYNADGKPSREPIIRKIVDAMDTTGRWYRGLIVNVERDAKTAEHNGSGSNGRKHKDTSKEESFRENTHVRIHFNDHHENHEEWIEVKSDRLAVAGRFTSNVGLESDSESDTASDTKSILPVSKKKDITQSNDLNHNALCLFPSYGACGLINLGNTCYANSGWQCLSYMPLLRSYLLSEQYKFSGDINRDNPLGTGGKILEEFADLMRIMWSGKFGARAPQRFRSVLTKCRPRYSGANQHDVPELLTDILDMLHEDANRVKKKPYVEALEDKFIEDNDIQRIGQEAWRRYLRRNRSVITDLCMGQLFNLVKCPECKHASKNFDPFNVLSLPLPTVDEVIFRCTIVRRATVLNCPSTLPLVCGLPKGKIQSINQLSPPSKELIFEEYAIPTSRLADLGDLKMKLEQLSGIPAKRLRLCKREKIETGIGDKHSLTNIFTKVACLPDKEGPCLRFLNHTSSDGSSSPTVATIVAFESTLQPRPEVDHNIDSNVTESDNTSTEDDTSSDTSSTESGEEDDARADWKMIVKMGEKCLEVYGDDNECLTYDTNPVPLAKYISHCQWPKKAKDFTLGLRVDAMDRRSNWYPGSVVEVIESESEDGHDTTTKVKVHFDNFSTKWDETYAIGSGNIRPLYSQSTPRAKPAEFVVHHRGLDHKTKKFFLFGQSFYLQCHNEWSTARAGAHLLAQASRFLEISHYKRYENGKKSSSVDRKIAEKERNNARKAIASIIQALIRTDKKYVVAVIENSKQTCQNGGYFDTASLSTDLSEKLNELLPFLPFDLRVTTADSPLGTNGEEVAYPFSLVRKIGNFMNARHSIVLHWRDNKATTDSNVESEKQLRSKQLLYIPPIIFPSKQNQKVLGTSSSDDSRRNLNSSHAGLHIGSCLAKFFEEQHLEATGWRCPVCKENREGKQSMSLWNLPDFLVFNFKRFNASSRWSEKITTRVDFPLTGLNMREWCDKQSPLSLQPSDEPFMYDLIGVVNHMGEIDTGHYIATCKATACSPDGNEEVAFNFNGSNTATPVSSGEESTSSGWRIGKSKEKQPSTKAASKAVSESAEPLWLKFDDELVEPIPPRTVVTEAAYVLFYKRRQMRPSNIAKYSSMD